MNQALPLRDIQLPDAVSWWPLAMGWWLLLLVMVVSILGGYWVYKKITRKTAVKSAQKILLAIKHTTSDDHLDTLKQLSACIRRVSISLDSRPQAASLIGEEWLSYLDQSMDGMPFTKGVGRYLSDAPYRREAPEELDIEALIDLCELWLKGQKK